jgi:hypothetical protein
VVRDFDKLRRFNVEQLYDQYQTTQEKGSEGDERKEGVKEEAQGTLETDMAVAKEEVGVVDDGNDQDIKNKAIE